MSFLTLTGLRKSYAGVRAVDGVDLAIETGENTAIVGPSGSGKTTLLRLIAGFEAPDAGAIVMDGLTLASGAKAVPAHRRNIGFVAQDGALFPHLSLGDNIGFGLDGAPAERARRIGELMAMVELDAAMTARRPDELSGGQQQRVALARALARRPKLMLLDEPFSALDAGLRVSTRKAVAALLRAEGVAAILVTHDQAEALSFAAKVAIIRDGRLPQVGTPGELYFRPKDAMIAAFLGEAIVLDASLHGGIAECALGALPVDDATRDGAARIMLRPEQIALTPAEDPPTMGAEASGRLGEVLAIDFGGAECSLSLRLLASPDAPPLRLRQSSFQAPAVGARVRIALAGKTHVFAD